MPRYLLLMRGDQSGFIAMSPAEKKKVIGEHVQYSKELEAKKVFLDGVGCYESTVLLEKKGNCIKAKKDPFSGTDHQVSGFYIIEAKNDAEAEKTAKGCPAFKHGETVEVIKLGH